MSLADVAPDPAALRVAGERRRRRRQLPRVDAATHLTLQQIRDQMSDTSAIVHPRCHPVQSFIRFKAQIAAKDREKVTILLENLKNLEF